MFKKYILKIVVLLLLALLASYFIPIQKKDFFTLYQIEDDASKNLKTFLQKPTKSVLVDGILWKYYVGGEGKETILFCHGMGGSYELWWQQLSFFEKDYRVISYSLPEKINSIEGASKGILAILDKEKITNFSLIGTSMGGYIGQYILQQIPDSVNAIVLSNTFPPNDIIIKENATKSKIIPLLPEILICKLANKQLNEVLVPAGENSKLLGDFLASLPFSKEQFINRYAIVVDYFELELSNPKIKNIPKLIVESDNDPLVKDELRKLLKKQYPKAQVVTFKNKGHFPYINASDMYNKELKKFFDAKN